MKYEQILKACGQEHVLDHYNSLPPSERAVLEDQLSQIDWKAFAEAAESEPRTGEIAPIAGLSCKEIAEHRDEFFEAGKRALRAGKLVCVLLAGGMGTRLGSLSPKGTFDVGVTRPLYIFEQQINNLLQVCKACECFVPLCIMTSAATDAETRAFLRKHAFFGYPQEYVRFFVQDMAPCTDFNGKILLEAKGRLALTPNGNGGWYSSLLRTGLLEEPLFQNAEWFNVYAVDNVLQRMADPVFLGATLLSGRASGAKVVKKTRPEERVGVLCLRGGLPDVVEYYEMDEETAALRGKDGELLYSYGVILNYLFQKSDLDNMLSCRFPYHKAKKRVPYWDRGETVIPDAENAYKAETLILDMVRLAGSCLPFEVERMWEFAPIKNRTGVDSVDSARELLQYNGVKL